MKLGEHLLQRVGKVAHEAAADAAGVHLVDLHAGVLEEAAVDGDLAELVFDQHDLFARVGLGDQFLMSVVLPAPRKPEKISILS